MSERYDALVVGAGFCGATLAERLTNEMGQRVLVVDERPYIGGSAHDYHDEHGLLVAAHGAHVFHTNAKHVVEYLSQFTAWMPYEHRVLARVGHQLVPVPINRTTVNRLFGLRLQTDVEVEAFFEAEREVPLGGFKTSEDQVVGHVGRRLYDLLYRDYTRKHWGRDASKLHASVAGRLPFRTNDDDRHFTDDFQAMPAAGYTPMFEQMLEGIDVALCTSAHTVMREVEYDHVFWTGRPDEFFGYCYGKLPFRSCTWERRWLPTGLNDLAYPVAVINEPSAEVPYTRSIEFRHITGQRHAWTAIHFEYPSGEGDPYYPVPSDASWALAKRYRDLASDMPDVTFCGRLGAYRYMTMDQTVAHALRVFEKHRQSLAVAA